MFSAEPPWWYGNGADLTSRLLRPAARVYGHLVERRFRKTTAYRAKVPVICVGNFTAGGTGKTPFTQLLARRLTARGARPAILTRGYGGSIKGPHWVVAEQDTAAAVGDEPLLLVRSAPVMVARDRAAGARAIETDSRAFTHIIMDDGLQNPALEKTLSFAVIDGRRGLGNGAVIPAGPMRAELECQLGRVNALVINGGVVAATPALPNSLAKFGGPYFHVQIVQQIPEALRSRPVVAYAGIGVPERFFAMLRNHGIDLKQHIAFGDHHVFSERDCVRIREAARTHQAVLATTEKDLVRLSGCAGSRAELARQSIAVPISLSLSLEHSRQLDVMLADLTARS